MPCGEGGFACSDRYCGVWAGWIHLRQLPVMHAWSKFCLICWSQTRNYEWSGASSTWLLQETSPGPMIETFPLLVCDMYFRLKVSSKSAQSKSIISRPMMLSPFDCPVFVDRCRELVRCTSISIRWISRYVLVSQFAKLPKNIHEEVSGRYKVRQNLTLNRCIPVIVRDSIKSKLWKT